MKLMWISICATLLGGALVFGVTSSQNVIARAAAREKTPSPAALSPQLKNLNADQAEKALAENKEIVILDVRTPREFRGSRIAGAKNIDFNSRSFDKEIAALDKDKTYLVHCAVGGRSAKAVEKMKQMNFKSILHLDGGLKAWEKEGKKVER
jgi:phage shock protein E